VVAIDAYSVGMAGVHLGVGRNRPEDDVLADVGVELSRKIGDRVDAGDVLCTVYGQDEQAAAGGAQRMAAAYTVADEPVEVAPVIVRELSSL
jgi:pyrimidine-nucleoside phosphorylase